jgi:indolepyruvate ferredoxin oxidoreductase alpha subunit
MGSGVGVANGFGQFERFGLEQPVLAVCGDSTFYHAAIPALINARWNGASFLLLVLDNSATAMTGFQPHPGTGRTAMGKPAQGITIEDLCRCLGAHVEVTDPFQVQDTIETMNRLLTEHKGLRVLVFRQECALVRSRHRKARYTVSVDEQRCVGMACGCARLCTRVFKCPGLAWDKETGKARIDKAICTNCGVCADICPQKAIRKEGV